MDSTKNKRDPIHLKVPQHIIDKVKKKQGNLYDAINVVMHEYHLSESQLMDTSIYMFMKQLKLCGEIAKANKKNKGKKVGKRK